MKRYIGLLLALCLILACIPAAAEPLCWYYNKHGTHDFEQVDIRMPSCETDGYYLLECRQCGLNEKQVTGKATGHAWNMVASVGSTCDKEGYEKYVCLECDEARTTTFPKLHHVWVDGEVLEIATCTQEGCVRTYCSLCHANSNRRTAKAAHKYGSWNVTTQATDHSQGKRERVCSVCGDKKTESFFPDGTLYRGMEKSDSVVQCQRMLIDLGFLRDKADGVFGKKTEQAVKDFQADAGLEVTGLAYPQTQAAISERYNQMTGSTPGVSITPEPDQTPTPPPEEIPEVAYCMCKLGNDGVEHITYCAKHNAMIEEFEEALSAAETEEAELLALGDYQSAWQAELDRLYDVYLASAAPEEKPGIAQAKSMFALHLSNQESLWTRKHPSQPIIVRKNILNAIIRHCVDLCQLTEENAMELISFSFSVSGMSSDQFRDYTVALTEDEYRVEYDLYGGRTVFTLQMDDEDINALMAIIHAHNLMNWDGFRQTNADVLDGLSFGLRMELGDGTIISASGNNAFPDGYGAAEREIIDFFLALMRKNGITIDE